MDSADVIDLANFPGIETPCPLLELPKLRRNLTEVQELADRNGIRLRPHIKTHKSIEIGRLQLEHGAAGITASKTDEALVFIEAGFRSITVAYPIVEPVKAERLMAAAQKQAVELRLIVDSVAGLGVISQTAHTLKFPVGVFIKVDVGLHRCGLKEQDPLLLDLADSISSDDHLRFAGLLSHAGHAYGAQDREHVQQIALEESRIMGRVKQKLIQNGLEVPEISVGSTPTVLVASEFSEITEIRPGNYVFMDRAPIGLGLIEPERVALTVLATVVSLNDRSAIIDAGSKVLSSDGGAHGSTGTPGFGLAYPEQNFPAGESQMLITKLSEEHGFVETGSVPLRLGERVRIIPNHACPLANLADSYTVIENENTISHWPVQARGRVL